MITIENNKECFVQLWLRLEPTRQLLEGQYKRFCVRNILRSWFGLRANDMFVWDVCSNSGLEGWQTLQSPAVCPRPLRDMLKAVVAVRMGISIKKVDVRALDAAYSIAFPNGAPLNIAHKKDPFLRREWGFAPLCGAAVTFSHYSKDPSRPLNGEGNDK